MRISRGEGPEEDLDDDVSIPGIKQLGKSIDNGVCDTYYKIVKANHDVRLSAWFGLVLRMRTPKAFR